MADLSVEHIAKSYPTPAAPLDVLQDASFEMQRGESLAIIGPSGSGKSTLLAIIGTLETPTSGSIRLAEVDPFSLPTNQLPQFRSERIGFVFQDHHLLPQCTVLENVLTPWLADRSAGEEEQQAAKQLIQRVGLADRLTHRPAELSGGERQRVAIARALVRQPLLILADEPTGNLDMATSIEVTKLLKDLQQETQSILITVTHSMDLAAAMDRTLRLEQGRLSVAEA